MPNYGSNLNLKQHQLLNVAFQKLATPPENPVLGQFYFNTDSGTLRAFYYNGTAWIGMDATGATMTPENIVSAINGSAFLIDDNNLSLLANEAITNRHTHSNKTVLDATTASFLASHNTKLGFISVTQAVDLDTMESNIATNNAKVTNATHTGDVTGSTALTIGANKVTNAMLATVPTATFKGRTTASAGNVEDLTVAQAKALLALAITDVSGLTTALSEKETPTGAQNKANTAETNANTFTNTAIANLVATAPDTLNTLNELAIALGNDPNFATTMTNLIATKTGKYSTTIGNGTLSTFTITHNLNTQNASITIRDTASPYEMWITDVAFTTANTITVSFGFIPTSNQFTVTVIG